LALLCSWYPLNFSGAASRKFGLVVMAEVSIQRSPRIEPIEPEESNTCSATVRRSAKRWLFTLSKTVVTDSTYRLQIGLRQMFSRFTGKEHGGLHLLKCSIY